MITSMYLCECVVRGKIITTNISDNTLNMADSKMTEMPDSWMTECLTVTNSSSLLNTKILVATKNSVVDDEIREVDLENDLPKTLTCEPCKKVYLTKGGYDRHVLRVHQTANIQLNDSDLEILLSESLKELSEDPCFPN